MSMTHDDAYIVQLESQTELLEGLHMFTRLDSNVICVEGESGSGKSWLAQRFLNTDQKIQTLSFLICLSSQTAEQQRSVLLGQLLSDSFCTGEETLVESLSAFRKNQECNATIIVDDAHFLAEHLLDELSQLVLSAQHNPLWQISVILFSAPNTINESLVETDPKLNVKRLTIASLSDSEANDFIEQLVIPMAHIDSEKKKQAIRESVPSVEHYPAALLALSESHKKPVVCWVKRSLIGLIIILLALGGWSWWTSYQARIQDQLAESRLLEEGDDYLRSSLDGRSSSTNQTSAAMVSGAESALTMDDSQKDRKNLPPAVTEKTLTVGDESDPEQKRVVVPSNVVDALLDGDSPKDAKLSNEEVDSTAMVTSSLSNSELTLANELLLAVSTQRYTLQLTAETNQQDTINFIQVHNLDGKVRVYRTIRNQQSWYVVTYQDYASIQQAREAAQQLPLALQKEQPWPKSMAQVHQEIERVK